MSTEVTIWNDDKSLEEVKKLFAPNLTNIEFSMFVQMGKATGLNPFLREIWAVKFGNNPAQIFVGRDGYRKSAQSYPKYDYHYAEAVYSNDYFKSQDGVYHHEFNLKDRGELVGAFCNVKRKDSTRPISVFVEFKEYDLKQSIWKTKPATMIKKVAESQALRMAFQEKFAGTYEENELDSEELSSQNSSRYESKQAQPAQLPSMPPPIENRYDEAIKVCEEGLDFLVGEIEKDIKSSGLPFGESNEDKKFIYEMAQEIADTYDIDKRKNDSLIKTICRTVLTKNPTKETIGKEITQLFYDVKKNRPEEINS